MKLAQSGNPETNAFADLARHALWVGNGHLRRAETLLAAGGMSEYLARVLRNCIQEILRSSRGNQC